MVESNEQRQRTYGQWWDSTEEQVTVALDAVRRVGIAGLQSVGATAEDAAFLLDIALDKAIQGDPVRGMVRVPRWVHAARQGDLDLRPQIQVLRETGATAIVDGGPKAEPALVCRHAIDLAIEKARLHGVGWVSARAHGEILTPFMKRAATQDMVAMVMTQSFPSVAPIGGMGPFLGNAPIGFGIPAGRRDPVILDMSVTQTSATPVANAARQEQEIPPDSILDERGEPTTDSRDFIRPGWTGPASYVPRGSLLPLGGARSGHKGYALVFVVGLLSYLLSDTSPPWDLGRDLEQPGRYGTLFLVIDPSTALPVEEFKSRVDEFIDRVKASPKKPDVTDILYPGERSQQLQREGKERNRVSIPASHYHALAELAREIGMEDVL